MKSVLRAATNYEAVRYRFLSRYTVMSNETSLNVYAIPRKKSHKTVYRGILRQ